MNLFEGKLFLVISSVLLAMGAIIVLVVGIVVPQSQYSGYTQQSCLVLNTHINHNSNYQGMVTLGYQNITKDINVYNSDRLLLVQHYLDRNYKNLTLVPCLVMGHEILVPISLEIASIFFGVLAGCSVLCMFMFFGILCREGCRRRKVGMTTF